MSVYRLLGIPFIFACFCISSPTVGISKEQNHSAIPTLDTVYALQRNVPGSYVPALVRVLDKSSITNTSDLSSMLRYIPGVEVANGPRLSAQTVMIRGHDSSNVLVLIDGRRQNFFSAHDGQFYIEKEFLKKVEIVSGGASASYGGGAIAGVYAVDTIEAKDFLSPGHNSGFRTVSGFRTAKEEIYSGITGYKRSSDIDLLISTMYRDSGNIRQGDGNELPTDTDISSGLFNARYTFDKFSTVKMTVKTHSSTGEETNNGAIAYSATENPTVSKKIQDTQYGLSYTYDNPSSSHIKPTVSFFNNDTKVTETDLEGTNAGRTQVRALKTMGVVANNHPDTIRIQKANGSVHENTLLYGLEIYKDEQIGTSSANTIRGGVPNAKGTNIGLHLQNELLIKPKDSYDEWLLVGSIRYDSFRLSEQDGSNVKSGDRLSPKISLGYKPDASSMLYLNLSNAYRAPALTEVYAEGTHFITGFNQATQSLIYNNFIQNTSLKPETVISAEIGGTKVFSDVFTNNDTLNVKTAIYKSYGHDFISQLIDFTANTTQFANVDKAELYGGEIDINYLIKRTAIHMGLSMSYAESVSDSGAINAGDYLNENVPPTFTLGISQEINENLVTGIKAKIASRNDKFNSNISGMVGTPGYTVYDWYMQWDNNFNNNDISIGIGVDNLFDKSYVRRPGRSPLAEEGRSLNLRLAIKW